jgi:hypothetical protein
MALCAGRAITSLKLEAIASRRWKSWPRRWPHDFPLIDLYYVQEPVFVLQVSRVVLRRVKAPDGAAVDRPAPRFLRSSQVDPSEAEPIGLQQKNANRASTGRRIEHTPGTPGRRSWRPTAERTREPVLDAARPASASSNSGPSLSNRILENSSALILDRSTSSLCDFPRPRKRSPPAAKAGQYGTQLRQCLRFAFVILSCLQHRVHTSD